MTMREKTGLALYMHAGSGNHGCEAIADSLLRQISRSLSGRVPGFTNGSQLVTLVTNSVEQDRKYKIGTMAALAEERHITDHFLTHAAYYLWRKVTGDRESFQRYRFRAITGANAPKLAVSIGGDNYCYPEMVEDLILADRCLRKQGTHTMLLGCSIEPDTLSGEGRNAGLIEDMKGFDRIIARETITYAALLEAGVDGRNLVCLPDPAFSLPVQLPGSEKAADVRTILSNSSHPGNGTGLGKESNAVGINLSPMAMNYAGDSGALLDSVRGLVRHILDDTGFDVKLIPHVVWPGNDDRVVLSKLRDEFAGQGRVELVTDRSAEELKGEIALCRYFIGARTHATIAAYSTGVPTIVIGYSVKARGIAQDIFGTADHYVIPVQELTGKNQLTDAFEWLRENEDACRNTIQEKMPGYINAADRNGQEILDYYRQI